MFRVLGIGQGMGWSPTLWVLVNDITLRVMEHYSPGQVFSYPLQSEEIFSCLEAYVDDVHCGVNLTETERYNNKNGKKLDVTDAIPPHLQI